MVSFQGLKAGTVESILDIWSSALRSASLSKLAASTGAFSSGTLLSKIFSSSLGCFFTYLKTVPEAVKKILNFFVGVCWGKKGCGTCWGCVFGVCGLGYRERESKEEGVLDLELVVIGSAGSGHTHVKKNSRTIRRF
jgi:hypothetical protein